MATTYKATEFLDTNTMVKGLAVIFSLQFLLTLALIPVHLAEFDLVRRIRNGEDYTQQEAQNIVQQALMVQIPTVLLMLVSIAVFLKLVGRLNHNAHFLGAEGLSQTPGWAIGSYFIPFANLWLPYVGMQEIWKVGKHGPLEWKKLAGAQIVGWWWLLEAVRAILNRIAAGLTRSEDFALLEAATYFTSASIPLELILCVFTWLLLSKASAQLKEQHARTDRSGVSCHACGEKSPGNSVTCPMCGATLKPAGLFSI